jgi:DMSO/TMAO reductase YedYZ heme-binding membrane subunit
MPGRFQNASRLERWTEGYRLSAWLIGLVALAVAVGCFRSGVEERPLRQATRWTVGMGTVLFTSAFVASSANRLARAVWSRWLLRNRRYLGLSFAGVHFLHAGCFLTLAFSYPASFWRTTSLVTVAGGSVGYVWLIAMTVTSFDRPTRAVGRRAWKLLHKSGVYVLWGILAFSYVGKTLRAPVYAFLVGLLFGALTARIVARSCSRPASQPDH